MAQVTIQPNSINQTSGFATGAVTDIDEGVSSADGNFVSTTADGEGEVLVVDFASPGLSDSDTITQVDIVVRHQVNVDSDSVLDVDLLIGGTAQGATQTTANRLTIGNDTLNDTGWNSDWTSTQLDGLQVQLTAAQGGMPTADQWDLDAIEVTITYTPGASTDDVEALAANQHLGHFWMPKALSTMIPAGFRFQANAEEAAAAAANIALESFSAATFETDAADNDLQLTYPSGIQADDLILVFLVKDWSVSWSGTGWTTVLSTRNTDPFHAASIHILGRVASGSESGTFTVTCSDSGGNTMGGIVARFSGVDVSGGIGGILDATSQSSNTAGTPDTNPIAPSITTNTNGAAVIYFSGNDDDHTYSAIPDNEIDWGNSGGVGQDSSLACAYKIQASAGASGTGSFTISSSDDWVTATLALKPA
jgi:hypothetical protein